MALWYPDNSEAYYRDEQAYQRFQDAVLKLKMELDETKKFLELLRPVNEWYDKNQHYMGDDFGLWDLIDDVESKVKELEDEIDETEEKGSGAFM